MQKNSAFSLNFAIVIAYAVLFFLIVGRLVLLNEPFEIDYDEGLNLIKSMLLGQGKQLYVEIWSDQPPAFTYLLNFVFSCFGYEVYVARLFVLGLTSLFIVSAWHMLAIRANRLCANIFVLLFAFLNQNVTYDVAIMIGWPAIIFAFFALHAFVLWDKSRNLAWLVGAAFLLSISVATKLFTLPLFFILAFWLFDREKRSFVAWWVLSFVGFLFAILLASHSYDHLFMLIDNHMRATKSAAFKDITFFAYLRDNLTLLALHLAGLVAAVIATNRKDPFFSGLGLWLIVSCALFVFWTPYRAHLVLLTEMPAKVMVAYLGGLFLTREGLLPWQKNALLAAFAVALMASLLIVDLFLDDALSAKKYGAETLALLRVMDADAIRQKAIFTDAPLLAFRAKATVDPYNAVLSKKRLANNLVSDKAISSYVEKEQPDHVLLCRFRLNKLEILLEKMKYQAQTFDKCKFYSRQP